jgi:hypothetical protein
VRTCIYIFVYVILGQKTHTHTHTHTSIMSSDSTAACEHVLEASGSDSGPQTVTSPVGGNKDKEAKTETVGISEQELKEAMAEARHFVDIAKSFEYYERHTLYSFTSFEAEFQQIPQALRQLVPGFQQKMNTLRQLAHVNQQLCQVCFDNRSVFQSNGFVVCLIASLM